MTEIVITTEECLAFRQNPEVNPLTGRKIKLHGPTYEKLKNACDTKNAKPVKIKTVKKVLKTKTVKKKVDTNSNIEAETIIPKPNTVKPQSAQPKTVRPKTIKPTFFEKLFKIADTTPEKTYVGFLIAGLGCNMATDNDVQQLEQYLQRYANMPVKFLCNKSTSSTVFDIAKVVCYLPPSKNSEFVRHVCDQIREYINKENHEVFVVGHSAGGAVVSRVAEIFNGTPNLHIATFGSIYISHPDTTSNIDIKHYMFFNDVALKCNKLKPKVDTHVTWLRPQGYNSAKKERFSLFGTSTQWQIHNNYEYMMFDVFKHRRI